MGSGGKPRDGPIGCALLSGTVEDTAEKGTAGFLEQVAAGLHTSDRKSSLNRETAVMPSPRQDRPEQDTRPRASAACFWSQ